MKPSVRESGLVAYDELLPNEVASIVGPSIENTRRRMTQHGLGWQHHSKLGPTLVAEVRENGEAVVVLFNFVNRLSAGSKKSRGTR